MDNFVESFIVSIDLSSFSFLDENGILLSQELLFCKQGVLHGYHLSWGIGSNDVNTLVFRIYLAPLLIFSRKSLQQHALIRTTMVLQVVEFSRGVGTKLERFLPRNQHTNRKLLNFENWSNGGPSRK